MRERVERRLAVHREGVQIDTPVRFGIVALDDGDDADERAAATLADCAVVRHAESVVAFARHN